MKISTLGEKLLEYRKYNVVNSISLLGLRGKYRNIGTSIGTLYLTADRGEELKLG